MRALLLTVVGFIAVLLLACALVFLMRSQPGAAVERFNSCKYVADAGYVCPITFADGDTAIRPFSAVPAQVQAEAVKHLGAEWPDTCGDAATIAQHWSGADVMYILTIKGEFVGSAAVDRVSFVAFISHLYVRPDRRKQGHARLLMRLAEDYTLAYGMSEARLWCAPDLLGFYTKLGYQPESVDRGVTVLVKRLHA